MSTEVTRSLINGAGALELIMKTLDLPSDSVRVVLTKDAFNRLWPFAVMEIDKFLGKGAAQEVTDRRGDWFELWGIRFEMARPEPRVHFPTR